MHPSLVSDGLQEGVRWCVATHLDGGLFAGRRRLGPRRASAIRARRGTSGWCLLRPAPYQRALRESPYTTFDHHSAPAPRVLWSPPARAPLRRGPRVRSRAREHNLPRCCPLATPRPPAGHSARESTRPRRVGADRRHGVIGRAADLLGGVPTRLTRGAAERRGGSADGLADGADEVVAGEDLREATGSEVRRGEAR